MEIPSSKDFIKGISEYENHEKRDTMYKALHLLSPKFFPIWDAKIARHYNHDYSNNPAKEYVSFCNEIKDIVNEVKNYNYQSNKTLIKLIDEYNYSKFTKGWI